MTTKEERVVRQLELRDAEVRTHERAHASTGGQYAGPPSYRFTTGPDGRAYAVSGEVSIDASPIPGDPAATIRKMQLVRRAALAPLNPSPQDIRIAAQAALTMEEARAELRELLAVEKQQAAPPEDNVQFNENGVSPAQAANAFGQAAQLGFGPTRALQIFA